jgi:putative tryptophan/tyrosine transport system substrate-binding protein
MKKAAVPSILVVVVLLAVGVIVHAQQPKSVPRIGYLSRDLHPSDSRASLPPNLAAFREGLRQLGYIEEKNIIIEYRYAEGRFERLPALAEELVRLKVEIIVVDTFTTVRAVRKVTTTIPIVVTGGMDPVGSGFVASLARPGGNVTGLTNLSVELVGKRLELLKEVIPKVSRFAFLTPDAETAASKAMFEDGQAAAKILGVKFQLVEVKGQDPDIDGAFRVMVKEHISAVITSPSPRLGLSLQRKRILQLLEQARMPAIHPSAEWVDTGGLMYYGANIPDFHRRAATYVDKILKGAKPADLPVEQPTKFELVINLKTARQIGVTIPPEVLARANRLIK